MCVLAVYEDSDESDMEVVDIAPGVENIFDKVNQDHLGGYNRVTGSDVALRERLYSKGRNYYIRINAIC